MRSRAKWWRVGAVVATVGLLVSVGLLTQVGQAWAKPPKILWLERSVSAVLEEGITALVVTGPSGEEVMYAGGRGAIVKSTNGGVTWTPVLLLAGRTAERSDDGAEFGIDIEDLERFEGSDALQQLEEDQEALLQELGDLYGDEVAEQLLLDLDDAMRQESADNLLAEIDAMLDDRDFDNRLGRLLASGLDEAEARTMAGGLLSIWQLALDPENPSAVYVAAAAGLYRSLNQGLTWERILPGASIGEQGASVLSVATVGGGSVVLAGTDAGLRLSDDGGRTWNPADSGDLGSSPVRATHCVPTTTRCVAASTRSFYLTDDAGKTWQVVNTQGFNASDVLRFNAIAAQPDDLWASTRQGLFVSNDGGQSWAAAGLSGELVRELAISPDGRIWAAATNSGVLRSDDNGQSWEALNAGLSELQVRVISGDPSADNALWCANDAGLFQLFSADKAGIKDEAARQLQTQWANEPTPFDVIYAALLFAELDTIPVDTLKTRVRLSYLAPRVVFSLNYATQRRERITPETDSASDITSRTGSTFFQSNDEDTSLNRQAYFLDPGLRWQVMALWDLGGLLNDPLEFAIESYADSMRVQRVRIIKRILRLLSKRRALQLKMAMESRANPARDAQNILKIQEFNALLNAHTGGFYNSALSDSQKLSDTPTRAPVLSQCLFPANCPLEIQ